MEIDGANLINDGREFQARAAATGNAWLPSDEQRVEGMRNIRASAERRRRYASESAARWRESARYAGRYHEGNR